MSALKIQFISNSDHRYPLGTIINAQADHKRYGPGDYADPFTIKEIDTEILISELKDNRYLVDVNTLQFVSVIRSKWKSVKAEEDELLLKARGIGE